MRGPKLNLKNPIQLDWVRCLCNQSQYTYGGNKRILKLKSQAVLVHTTRMHAQEIAVYPAALVLASILSSAAFRPGCYIYLSIQGIDEQCASPLYLLQNQNHFYSPGWFVPYQTHWLQNCGIEG